MKTLKKVSILLIILAILIALTSCVFATDAPTISQNIVKDSTMNTAIAKVYGVVAYVIYAVAVVIVLIKGVKFMTAAPEAKAEIKKEMIAVVIGAFLVFGIQAIGNLIINVGHDLF